MVGRAVDWQLRPPVGLYFTINSGDEVFEHLVEKLNLNPNYWIGYDFYDYYDYYWIESLRFHQ